jgi:hypothetical protein
LMSGSCAAFRNYTSRKASAYHKNVNVHSILSINELYFAPPLRNQQADRREFLET